MNINFILLLKEEDLQIRLFFFKQLPPLLKSKNLESYLIEKIMNIGTSACPPYHLAVVIGGLSAEMNLKTLKLASSHFLDTFLKKEINQV